MFSWRNIHAYSTLMMHVPAVDDDVDKYRPILYYFQVKTKDIFEFTVEGSKTKNVLF